MIYERRKQPCIPSPQPLPNTRAENQGAHGSEPQRNPFHAHTTIEPTAGGWLVCIDGLLKTVVIDFFRDRALERAIEQHEKVLAVYHSGISLR